MKRNQDHFRGCIIGGAIGDALGRPIELLKSIHIKRKYGERGLEDFALDQEGVARITDDTQMTLFTAEGILRAEAAARSGCSVCPDDYVYCAYQRWMVTQAEPMADSADCCSDGWLLGVKELHSTRGPGYTCLSSLAANRRSSIENPLNSRKGCGGVMRVAPAGLHYPAEKVFLMGAEFAAITHGHPSGYLSAGALASIIASLIMGSEPEQAVEIALDELKKYRGHEECLEKIEKAVNLAKENRLDCDALEAIGGGWVGEEAIAIAIYCTLKHKKDFRQAVIAAVNHSGDSDSTGSITGNICGAYLGIKAIPEHWLKKIELRDVILQISDDLLLKFSPSDEWKKRYPVT